MGQVTGMTAAEVHAELGEAVVSGNIDASSSHLLLRTKAGGVIDAGAVGGNSGTAPYEYTQSVAQATWTVNHNLGYDPVVIQVFDSGGHPVEGFGYTFTMAGSQFTVEHDVAVAGKVRFR